MSALRASVPDWAASSGPTAHPRVLNPAGRPERTALVQPSPAVEQQIAALHVETETFQSLPGGNDARFKDASGCCALLTACARCAAACRSL